MRVRSWALRACVVLLFALAAAEGVLRFGIGLGDPPLYMLDDRTEYRLVPSQSCRRFGNSLQTNSVSMRSPEPPSGPKKAGELRVLVLGDSIVNGGGKVDQRELATTLLRDRLAESENLSVWVGNASAGSWGPPNELAYVRAFGLFDADVVIVVLNSADAGDAPGLEAIGPQWPRRKPVLALEEAFSNYGLRIIHRITKLGPRPARSPDRDRDARECADAIRELGQLVETGGAKFVIVLYPIRTELENPSPDGLTVFRNIARQSGWMVADTGEAFRRSIAAGEDPFLPGDAVHAGPTGQRALADVLERCVRESMPRPPVDASTATPEKPVKN